MIRVALVITIMSCIGCDLGQPRQELRKSGGITWSASAETCDIQIRIDQFRGKLASLKNSSDIGFECGKLYDLSKASGLSHKQWIEQLFLQTLPAKEPDGVGAWAAQGYFVKMNHLFDPTVTPRDYLDALAGPAESADFEISQRALGMLDSSGVFSRHPTGDAGDFVVEYGALRDFLPRDDNGMTHPRLITHLYEIDPDAALTTVGNAYLKDVPELRQRLRQSLEFRALLLADAFARMPDPSGAKAADHDIAQKLSAKIMEFAKSESWPVRAYAVAVLSQHKVVVDDRILENLRHDAHPVVTRLMTNVVQQ